MWPEIRIFIIYFSPTIFRLLAFDLSFQLSDSVTFYVQHPVYSTWRIFCRLLAVWQITLLVLIRVKLLCDVILLFFFFINSLTTPLVIAFFSCFSYHFWESFDFLIIWFTLNTHTHTRLTALFLGLPSWAGTRKVKPIWILLKQETMSGSGCSWAICKSAPCSRQITTPSPHHSVFYWPDALPAAQPTASKHWRQITLNNYIEITLN